MEVIAEIGASHNQDYQTALDLVFAAQESGADTVKVQMFTADQMTLNRDWVIKEGRWAGYNLYSLYKEAQLPLEFVPKLKTLCDKLKMGFMATVYHPDMVKTAENMGIKRYKISSFELPWIDLIKSVAKTRKPLVLSVGMADYKEISLAVKTVKSFHNNITLLWCISEYPAVVEKMNLKTIVGLGHAFKCKSGLSDHSDGFVAPVVAACLGACMLEKHIKIDGGLDESFALSPIKFKAMVDIVRSAEKSIGQITYGGTKKFRRKEVEGKWIRTL